MTKTARAVLALGAIALVAAASAGGSTATSDSPVTDATESTDSMVMTNEEGPVASSALIVLANPEFVFYPVEAGWQLPD